MARLARDTELRLAPEVELSLSGDRLWLRAAGSGVNVRASILPVLDLFREPLRLEEVMERLPASTALDWVELSAEIFALHEEGVLVGKQHQPKPQPFASTRLHVRMLEDEVRTKTYVEAIRSFVEPGDVVVEIGCGTGVLSVAAAQAGARKVYAIEFEGIAEVAAQVFVANGVDDRVQLIRGKSTAVELPERADVLLSEIVGNDPFGENILDYTRDALARMLGDNPRVLPRRLRASLVPVTMPLDLLSVYTFQPEAASRWSQRYGIDFAPLVSHRPPTLRAVYLSPEDAARLEPRGPAQEFSDVDLHTPPARIDATMELAVATAGRVDGIMVKFEIDLAEGYVVACDPWSSRGATSWKVPMWLLPLGRDVPPGDMIRARYEFTGIKPRLSLLETDGSGMHDPR